jgi:DNA repair exonuclease SbcCD ATPase subunit
MNNREKYQKLKTERDALIERLSAIPRYAQKLAEEAGPLAEQAVRSEILGEEQTAALKIAVKKNSDESTRLSAELEDGRRRLKVMNEVLRELAEKTQSDEIEQHTRRYRAALSRFVSVLRSAASAEREVIAVREAVRKAFDEIDSRCPLDTLPTIVLRDASSDAMQPTIESFIQHAKLSFGIEE